MKTHVDVRVLLDKLGIRIYKHTKNEYIIKCPFHDDQHPSASVNESKQVFNCFSCGGKSIERFVEEIVGDNHAANVLSSAMGVSPDRLEEELHDILDVHTDPFVDEEALEEYESYNWYLKERGISVRQAAFYGIRYSRKDKRVAIPIRDHSGVLRGILGRAISPRMEPRYLPLIDCHFHNYLFGEYLFETKRRRIVVEGPFAVFKLRSMGYPAVAAMTSKISQEQMERLITIESVTLALDNDVAGQKGVEKAITSLPDARIVIWPGDVDAISRKETRAAIKGSISVYQWLQERPEAMSKKGGSK